MSNERINISDIAIRTELRPGDIGYVTYLHGTVYYEEYQYGIPFESYVAGGLDEFYSSYNPERERVWICEHRYRIVGFLLLADKGHAAQLRYFIILPEYRGIGLGSKLMQLYMDFLRACGYQSSFLLTTHELTTAAHLYKKHGFRFTEEKHSAAFGKPLRQQRYDVILEERFLDITNPARLFKKLAILATDTSPLFGSMSAQQMVEHLGFVVRISCAKEQQQLSVSGEEAERAKRFVVHTDKELPQGILFPGTTGKELLQLKHPDLEAAVTVLRQALEDFHSYFRCNPAARPVHPVLGELDYREWIIFHNKHFTHHLKQYGIL